jgi:hypothetical protein
MANKKRIEYSGALCSVHSAQKAVDFVFYLLNNCVANHSLRPGSCTRTQKILASAKKAARAHSVSHIRRKRRRAFCVHGLFSTRKGKDIHMKIIPSHLTRIIFLSASAADQSSLLYSQRRQSKSAIDAFLKASGALCLLFFSALAHTEEFIQPNEEREEAPAVRRKRKKKETAKVGCLFLFATANELLFDKRRIRVSSY